MDNALEGLAGQDDLLSGLPSVISSVLHGFGGVVVGLQFGAVCNVGIHQIGPSATSGLLSAEGGGFNGVDHLLGSDRVLLDCRAPVICYPIWAECAQ